jgi:antitoxin component of RelBE/YafQ-DinJ toxin-antitoxin module
MSFNREIKSKLLRTQLDDETHTQFKMLAAEMHVTMARLVEMLIKERLAQGAE